MDADAFRFLYDYHFALNRYLWDGYIAPLTDEQFVRDATYSHGSVQGKVLHLIYVDDGWFSELRGVEPLPDLGSEDSSDREKIRARWDTVEDRMRVYLAELRDDMLLQKPFSEGEDKDLILWQILFHVANHGTDHRAQILRQLHDLGADTTAQDFVYYAYEKAQQ